MFSTPRTRFTEVTVVPEAEPGSEFVEFFGECAIVTGNECELTMDEEHSVTATFDLEPQEFALNIEEPGTGSGTVECEAQAGKAQLKLSCTGGACKGSLKLSGKNKAIGKASFSLASGAAATLKVKLSAPALKVLKSGKALKAKLSGTGIAASAVKLKAAKG